MNVFNTPMFPAPAPRFRRLTHEMINYGRQVRDELLWNYPLLNGACLTFQEMASSREWKVVGSARGVARAVESINEAQCIDYNGLVDYGFEPYLKRRVMDYLCVGMETFTWNDSGVMRYLDPVDLYYDMNNRLWKNSYTKETFSPDKLIHNYPIPVGSQGFFVSPLSLVIPTAMLAWLIREHDKAAADGRKIRDIQLVIGENLSQQIQEAMEQTVALWSGADPTKNGVPVVFVENSGSLSAQDFVTTLGIARIPEGFNRDGFQFQYVNEIAAALGLSLRHFWNSEKATNRALEEVQEARQQQKGPSAFVRTEQRLINRSGYMRQFGPRTRFAFIEEVDTQTRINNANVVKLFSEGLAVFAKVFNASINGEAFLAWLQSEGILPADLELLADVSQQGSDDMPTPQGDTVQAGSDDLTQRSVDIDYGEIAMNGDGVIIERRAKVYTIERAIRLENPEVIRDEPVAFADALQKAREDCWAQFREEYPTRTWRDQEQAESLFKVEHPNEQDYRLAKLLLDDGT